MGKRTFFQNKYCNKFCLYTDPFLTGQQMKAYKEPVLQSQYCFHTVCYDLEDHEDMGIRRGSGMKSYLLLITV